MKKYFILLSITLLFILESKAQAPQGFNYQATVRNSAGELIVNTNVYFKFNVMQESQTSLPVFVETHYVPTDDLGQINLIVGQGTANTGVFAELDWSLGSYYLGIELDTGNGFVAMGTNQLLSVPYALYAENSGDADQGIPTLESVLTENNSANNQQVKDLQNPTDAQDASTKNYVDTEIENNHQNIEQVLTIGNNANSQQLKGLTDPTDDQDAATKAYTDALVINLQSQIDNLHPPADGIPLFGTDPSVFDNPISNESELITMLADTQKLLTSYSWSVMTAEIASDNALKGGDVLIGDNDQISLTMIDNFTHTPTNQILADIWNYMHGGYNRASYAYIKGSEISDIPQKYLAEALFLRAFYAYNLIEWFGHFPRINQYDENNHPILSYSSIGVRSNLLIELKLMLGQAILIAENHGVSSSGRTMITKNAMLALLSKIQFKLGYGGSLETKNILDEIISSSQYSLETDYEIVFEDGPTASSVFDIDCIDNELASFACVLCSQGNVMAGFQGIKNYVGPEFSRGFGFNIPTEESYNSFDASDIRRDVALLNISEWASQTGAIYEESYQHTGFFNKKYLPRPAGAENGDYVLNYGNDIKVIRYAEILLLRSESSLMSYEYDESLYYLNLVRNRAGLPNVISSEFIEIRNFIIQERRSEFMGEGKRFFDLVHFNLADQELEGFINGKNEVFPIPQYFIDMVNFSQMGIIFQNPGY